ncbi:MAG: hypothetical protein JXR96_23240 [Deltaproteobacteria bacterium]|nr:hypothetical protein [Deltaproteobacteria bacterium]
MPSVSQADRMQAARVFGEAMRRLKSRETFQRRHGPDDAQELFAFVQALQIPAGDGRHLAGVVRSLSKALQGALKRRSGGA